MRGPMNMKLITKYTIVVCDGNYKQSVYLISLKQSANLLQVHSVQLCKFTRYCQMCSTQYNSQLLLKVSCPYSCTQQSPHIFPYCLI